MDAGELNLFIKQLSEEYALSPEQASIVFCRLLADESEFDLVWKVFKAKSSRHRGGVDRFRPILQDLLT